MKNSKLFLLVITVLICVLFFLNQDNEKVEPKGFLMEKFAEKEILSNNSIIYPSYDTILEESISKSLKVIINRLVWFDRDSDFCYLANKECSYEYYIIAREVKITEKFYYEIAVLIEYPIPIKAGGVSKIEKYHVFTINKDSLNLPDVEYSYHWYRDTLEENKDILREEGWIRQGIGTVNFEDVKEPDYGEVSKEKLDIVQDIARLFMTTIADPQAVTELYIMNFYNSSTSTKVLYRIDDTYYEANIDTNGGRYYKPFSVSEFDDDGYYVSQFKKIAFTIDVTDIENPKIVLLPGGQLVDDIK